MHKIVVLLSVIGSLSISIALAQTPTATTQASQGDCSPNSGYILNSTFICFETKLSAQEQRQLSEIKKALEQIAKNGGPAQQQIVLRLNSIASLSKNKFVELASLYRDLQKNIANIGPQLSRIEDVVSDLSARAYVVYPQPIVQRPPNLDSKVDLSHLQLAKKDKSLRAVIADSQCTSLTFSPDLEIRHVDLMKLIVNTESMECNEKQYWYDILPAMNTSQIDRLFDILMTERRRLEKLEVKYQEEIKCLNAKHLFEWSVFQQTKTETLSKRNLPSTEQYKAAVEYAELECPLEKSNDIQKTLDTLVATDPLILTSDAERAYLLAKVYSTKQYEDRDKRLALLKLANERSPDNWDYFADLVRYDIDTENWHQVFGITKATLTRNVMPELSGNSERDIGRKLLVYWWYLYSATQLGEDIDINRAAITGYNLTKLLLERNPSHFLLHKIAFFSGHIWRSSKIDPKLKDEYFQAILTAADRLRNSSRMSDSEYVSAMLSISWYCLIARAPETALKAAEAGLKVDPKATLLYTNLAHAYLMIGQQNQAYDVYKRFAGQQVDGRLWNDIVLDDFRQLQKAGVILVKNPNDRTIFSQ